ncbi:MAG: hypothetical protein ICV63_07830 [Coleofasciculus sp. Co-bin14]|nr:hypothetical protein [Coleofasciculus sp. Co-bin14]
MPRLPIASSLGQSCVHQAASTGLGCVATDLSLTALAIGKYSSRSE